MLIELSDFLIHLNRLGLLMVCVAVWLVVPELLPEEKKSHWRAIAESAFGKTLDLVFTLLFVCGVCFYTVLLFLLTTMVLQQGADLINLASSLNFMVILIALPIAGAIQIYTVRRLMGLAFPTAEQGEMKGRLEAVRLGTLLLSGGFFFQFLATFG